MAKTIKFPLDMGDGKKVRTIEELRESFDAEKLVGHFVSGKLQTWLADRHYKNEHEQIMKLEIGSEKILQELCAVFQIEPDLTNIKVTEVLEKERLVKELRQFTDDEEILNHLDRVAVNQEQLDGLLRQSSTVIYLFGENFEIPCDLKNIQIKGINTPVLKVKTDEVIDFKGVEILNCSLDEAYNSMVERKKIEEENAHKKKRKTYKASKILDYRLSDEARKGSEKLFNIIQEGLLDFEFDVDRYGIEVRKKIEDSDLRSSWDEFLHRIS